MRLHKTPLPFSFDSPKEVWIKLMDSYVLSKSVLDSLEVITYIGSHKMFGELFDRI